MKDNICVFQVVEERIFPLKAIDRKWIVLKKHIDYKNGRYISIQPFHDDWIEYDIEHIKEFGDTYYFTKYWLNNLFSDYGDVSPIETLDNIETIEGGTHYDTIRNPTVQELNFINLILKINKCKFNRKTNQLIDNDNE